MSEKMQWVECKDCLAHFNPLVRNVSPLRQVELACSCPVCGRSNPYSRSDFFAHTGPALPALERQSHLRLITSPLAS